MLSFFMLFFMMYFLLNESPMILLIYSMVSIALIVAVFFSLTLEYWFSFLLILSFLVGLFLLFVYLVSLNKSNQQNTSQKVPLSAALLVLFCLLNMNQSKALNSNDTSFCSLENLYENPNELILICVMLFLFFIIFLFFFMKKNKKMMKKSS